MTNTARSFDPPTVDCVGEQMEGILAASPTSHWQTLDPEETLYVDIEAGRVVIMLAPVFAPKHVANIKALAREHYFDGMPITRVQDNAFVQWGVFEAVKEIHTAKRTLPAEFDRPLSEVPNFTSLPDSDGYASKVGFASNFPAACDCVMGRVWLAHCYGMVGSARLEAADSGGGSVLFAVIGHAPRYLDRNTTLVGRVVHGMELLSSLPRGTGAAGYYEKSQPSIVINSIRVAADLPVPERLCLEVLRTDSATFQAVIDNERSRRDPWYKVRTKHIDLGNISLPVRTLKGGSSPRS